VCPERLVKSISTQYQLAPNWYVIRKKNEPQNKVLILRISKRRITSIVNETSTKC
jgi:hypothetical protein